MERGLLPRAVPLQQFLLVPGERADVIVHFTGIRPGTNFLLSNNANAPFPGGGRPGGPGTPDRMRFGVVPAPVGAPADVNTRPASLRSPAVAPFSTRRRA